MFQFLINLFRQPDPAVSLKALLPELKELQNQLALCWQTYIDPLERIVPFFQIVSKWHDRAFDEVYEALERGGPKYVPIIEHFKVLCAHFSNAGRSMFGWNRTEAGEKVTAEKVFLGNIYGLFTHPVSHWLTLSVELGENELTHPAAPNKSPRQIVTDQAYQFMWSHTRGIHDTVSQIEKALELADKRSPARPTPALASA